MAQTAIYPVFISYRSDDTAVQAGRLRDSINHYFQGKEVAFLDDSLKPGDKWPERLREAVRSAQVVLVLIGDEGKWLGVDPKYGKKRIDDKENDWVFQEVNTALHSPALVVPILFGNAGIPPGDVLPEEIRSLPDLQAEKVHDIRKWEKEIAPLLTLLEDRLILEDGLPLLSARSFDPLQQLPICHEIALPGDPYKGLGWFAWEDARIFFGRGNDIFQLNQNLHNPHAQVVLFYGQSGAGKSSLLQAGFLPRLPKEWAPTYARRSRDGSAWDILEGFLMHLQRENPEKPLLILDQLEEMYTHRDEEPAELPALLHEILGHASKPRVILGYREDYHARIEELIRANGIIAIPQPLKNLTETQIAEAVAGILNNPELAVVYQSLHLPEGEAELPHRIGKDLVSRPDSRANAAPLLQFILRQMWDEVKASNPAAFTWELFTMHRRESMLELLDTRLEALQKTHSEAAESGLALDLLKFLVTEDDTAGHKKEQGLFDRYAQHSGDTIQDLCEALENHYLISNFSAKGEKHWRLAHDALGRAVRIRFEESNAPGQRAWRLVEAKQREIGFLATFSESDIETILAGEKGMQKIPDRVMDQILEDQQRYERQKQDRFLLAFDGAWANVQHLNYLEALKKLRIARMEGIQFDTLLDLAIQLLHFFLETGDMEEFKSSLHFIQSLDENPGVEPLLEMADFIVADKKGSKERLQNWNPDLYQKMERRHFPEMCPVIGGTYRMGSGEDIEAERPVHKVTVSDFLMGATPVTWWQYGLFCRMTGRDLPNDSGFGRGDKPVINLTWYEAVAYCNWMTEWLSPLDDVQLEPVYYINDDAVTADWSKNGFRLPTEAEWEYAAREKGQNVRFGNGKDVANPKEMNFDASHPKNERQPNWYVKGKGRDVTTFIREFPPNKLGLFDMSGNVFEWCWDWWSIGENHFYKLSDGASNPKGPESGQERVVRGGSWVSNAYLCRCSFRNGYDPLRRFVNLGFRVVRRS
ncbi:MAG: SUMF1/EgtB/PvdO family nonheme iron enzyme [Lewinellaceae bacterium]|nr:SUMF1/EgtB/PvdO family nonheme iron enzyme [Lewinellaceae bacterium]